MNGTIMECPAEAATLFRFASRIPLVSAADRRQEPVMERSQIEGLLPHRGALLLIDRIVRVDRSNASIACGYDLARATPFADGHFPDRPVFPGVLQLEAMGQAGLCMHRLLDSRRKDDSPPDFTLTHVLGARFVRPVSPLGVLDINARVVYDGLFTIVIGQCLQHEAICSVAVLRGIDNDTEND